MTRVKTTYFLDFSSSYLARNSIGVLEDSAIFLFAWLAETCKITILKIKAVFSEIAGVPSPSNPIIQCAVFIHPAVQEILPKSGQINIK